MRAYRKLLSLFRSVSEDRRGSAVVYFALALPVMMGAVGMAVDISSWHADKRIAQGIADSAAVSGALELVRTGASAVDDAARFTASQNGYKHSANETLTISRPPTDGPYAGVGDAVEVKYTSSVPTLFASLFMDQNASVSARAVARAQIDDTCVWALNKTDPGTLNFSGGGTAAFYCGLLANSSDPGAINQSGGGCVSATGIKTVGGYVGDCLYPAPITGAKPVLDPFATLPVPTYSGCDYNGNQKANGSQTITLYPGVYCNGTISAVSNGHIIFEPGLYILDQVGMNFGGQSTVNGTGVTFYLAPTASSSDNITIQAGATVNLTAPTTGPYAGILFYQDRNTSVKMTHNLTGGASMNLDGVIYFPNQDLKFAGGSITDNSSSILIADTVTFTGQSYLGDFDGSAAQANPNLVGVSLLE